MSNAALRPMALVPARGGSKRFPRKNVADLEGRPLLGWTVAAALDSGVFDRVWVSSEDAEILRVAEEQGGTPLPREAALGGDRITVSQVALAAAEQAERLGARYDALYLLLPTSPFRRAASIRQAWSRFRGSSADALLSVVPLAHPPEWALIVEDGVVRPRFPEEFPRPRPDLTPALRHDGSHAISRLDSLRRLGDLVGGVTLAFDVSAVESVDVNEPLDLAWARYLLSTGMVE